MTDAIKPVAWVPKGMLDPAVPGDCFAACRFQVVPESAPLYPQSAIDALRAEVERLRARYEALKANQLVSAAIDAARGG